MPTDSTLGAIKAIYQVPSKASILGQNGTRKTDPPIEVKGVPGYLAWETVYVLHTLGCTQG
jgi:hypothetical protein